MAITLNAKGTSVPYFKIGKSGTTLFQGADDPHVSGGYSVQTNDIWFDTAGKTLKFRTSSQTWQALAETDKISEMTDVDLTGLADGNFLRYDSSSNSWSPYAVTGGLSNDWGSIADQGITVDGYTGDVWQLNASTGTLSHSGNATVTGTLQSATVNAQTINATTIVSDSIPADVNELSDVDGLLNHVSTTDDVTEGSNLYYTDERVEAHLDSGTSTPTLASATINGTVTADTVEVSNGFVLPKGTSHPANPVEGQMWFNTSTKKFEGFDGTSWIVFSPEDWGSIG